MNPVTEDIAPGYFQMIDRPMDISTIRSNLKEKKYYTSWSMFEEDLRLIYTNCQAYNWRTMKTMRKPNEGCTKRRKTVEIRLDRITFSVNPMSIENRSINDVRPCKRTATINFCKRTGITATGCRFWSTIPIMSQI